MYALLSPLFQPRSRFQSQNERETTRIPERHSIENARLRDIRGEDAQDLHRWMSGIGRW